MRSEHTDTHYRFVKYLLTSVFDEAYCTKMISDGLQVNTFNGI